MQFHNTPGHRRVKTELWGAHASVEKVEDVRRAMSISSAFQCRAQPFYAKRYETLAMGLESPKNGQREETTQETRRRFRDPGRRRDHGIHDLVPMLRAHVLRDLLSLRQTRGEVRQQHSDDPSITLLLKQVLEVVLGVSCAAT